MNVTEIKLDLRELRDHPSLYDVDTHAELHNDALAVIAKLERDRRESRRETGTLRELFVRLTSTLQIGADDADLAGLLDDLNAAVKRAQPVGRPPVTTSPPTLTIVPDAESA